MEKKNNKIAIQTCFINNYGACLQCFAMQDLFSHKYGFETKILPFDRYSFLADCDFLKTKFQFLSFSKSLIKFNIMDFFRNYSFKKNFSNFRKKYLIFNSQKLTREYEYFRKLNNEFDYFVCGSDVIWNPNFRKENLYFDMFGFAEENKCIFSYAPSFGVEEVSQEVVDECSKYLQKFDLISCRESNGVDLLKNQFKMKSTHVLNPTLMIEAERWTELSKDSYSHDKKYVVIYMFDDFPLEKIATKILSETNFDILLFNFKNKKNFKKLYKSKRIIDVIPFAGPFDFVNIIKNAECVLGNSLHALAFCINLNTPFVLFDRDNYDSKHSINSRLYSMIKMFKFNDKILTFDDFLREKFVTFLNTDFTSSNLVLKKERLNSHLFIEEALKNGRNN